MWLKSLRNTFADTTCFSLLWLAGVVYVVRFQICERTVTVYHSIGIGISSERFMGRGKDNCKKYGCWEVLVNADLNSYTEQLNPPPRL